MTPPRGRDMRCLCVFVWMLVGEVMARNGADIEEVEIDIQDFSFSSVRNGRVSTATRSSDTKTDEMLGRRQGSLLQAEDSWWPYFMDSEISQNELMMMLVVIIALLATCTVVGVTCYAVIRHWWRTRNEKRLVRIVAMATAADDLEKTLVGVDETTSPMLHALVKVRKQELEFKKGADDILESTSKIQFDDESLVLTGMPVDQRRNAMTFMDVLTALEKIQVQGEATKDELGRTKMPAKWDRLVQLKPLRYNVTLRVETLKNRRSDVQTIEEHIVQVIETRHVEGNPIPKSRLLPLVAALRQLDEKAEEMRLGNPGKDEFSFLVASFDKMSQRQRVQAELNAACIDLKTAASAKSPVSSGSEDDQNEDVGPESSVASPHAVSSIAQRLETCVQHAEELEMSHLAEVKEAQYLLEDTHRDTFCMLTSREAVSNVNVLSNKLVEMGVDHKSAVLKAAGICADQSNMLMLTGTLRGLFDEFRRTEMIKMEQRRKRDAQKEADKRIRILQKFRCKQQLMLNKIELDRKQQEEQREHERQEKEKEEREASIVRVKKARKHLVWQVTKLDILVVIMGMGIVFFENLTRIEILRPVCREDNTSSFLMSMGWWPAQTLQLLQCRVLYALKIAGVFIGGGLVFFVAGQLSILTTILPALMVGALYYVRTEWMNMLFRLPFLLVLYAFNSASLYMLNRIDPMATNTLRHTLYLYVMFPLVSLSLSAFVSVAIACDKPDECFQTGLRNTQQTFSVLGGMFREAYRL